MREHDVVIAGGGMAGASLAIGLAERGFDIAVIEAVDRDADLQPSYDDRTLVMNRASLNILTNLGILDDKLPRCPIRHIDVTRAAGFGHVRLNARDHDLDRFGAVIVARELGNRLLACIEQAQRVTQYCPERLETFHVEGDRVRIRLASGAALSTRLLVGADGTGSGMRQAAGIASTLHDYRQSAMIFNVTGDPPATDVAHERFTPAGPLAFLPQPAGRYGVVWIDDSNRIDQAIAMDDEALLRSLRERAGSAFSDFSDPGTRARYPLKLLRTRVPIGERTVVIGNAATTVHPVSAQGFNLGLRDVATLIEVLEKAHDPGAAAWMARYAQRRRSDQAETVRYTDTLARVFTNPSALFRLGTGVGLAAHALVPSLRKQLVISAMGFREPVSRLAREVR